MSTAIFTYRRTDRFVKNTYTKKDSSGNPLIKDGKPVTAVAHGLVGELWVHGLQFETIERMDGYMHMKGGQTYHNSAIYWHDKYKSFVINPALGKEQEKTKGNILMHPGSQPSHLQGCVAVGFFNANGKLEGSKYCFDVLREQAGGAGVSKDQFVTLTLVVEGNMPALSACKSWVYSA
ncbi:hypothetical protein G3576_01910 [Roseomonas stagni]|uniref:DUF5675 domain-containing protein n=1 Tax=Falsiroseomonas algicola TaxID=2716930 RepID=A0A6M1LEP3_9PROT|nr:hypothetical protein [Falsiroseomonas algicola]NGM18750.1 hypothetical protein [Falsiroseomonas algicola]